MQTTDNTAFFNLYKQARHRTDHTMILRAPLTFYNSHEMSKHYTVIKDHMILSGLSSLPYFLLLQSIRIGMRKNPQCCSKRARGVYLSNVIDLSPSRGERTVTCLQSHVSCCYSYRAVMIANEQRNRNFEKNIYDCNVA